MEKRIWVSKSGVQHLRIKYFIWVIMEDCHPLNLSSKVDMFKKKMERQITQIVYVCMYIRFLRHVLVDVYCFLTVTNPSAAWHWKISGLVTFAFPPKGGTNQLLNGGLWNHLITEDGGTINFCAHMSLLEQILGEAEFFQTMSVQCCNLFSTEKHNNNVYCILCKYYFITESVV